MSVIFSTFPVNLCYGSMNPSTAILRGLELA